MNPKEIRTALSELAERELRFDGKLPEGDLAEHLDSVQRLTLVVAIEDRFHICFDPEDEANLVTLDDLVGAIASKLEESNGSGDAQ